MTTIPRTISVSTHYLMPHPTAHVYTVAGPHHSHRGPISEVPQNFNIPCAATGSLLPLCESLIHFKVVQAPGWRSPVVHVAWDVGTQVTRESKAQAETVWMEFPRDRSAVGTSGRLSRGNIEMVNIDTARAIWNAFARHGWTPWTPTMGGYWSLMHNRAQTQWHGASPDADLQGAIEVIRGRAWQCKCVPIEWDAPLPKSLLTVDNWCVDRESLRRNSLVVAGVKPVRL